MRKEGKMPQEIIDKMNAILQKEISPIFNELAIRIDARLPDSQYWPWMLAYKMDENSAKVVLALPDTDWTPEMGEFKCSEEFAQKLGMDKEYIESQLEERFYSGEIMWLDKGAIVTPSSGTWLDLQNSRRWYDKLGIGYYKCMAAFVENDVAKIDQRIAAKYDKDGKMGWARIIPRYDSVKDYPGLLPAENVKEIFRSRDIIAQNQCACRIRYPEFGLDPYVCMAFNNTAKIAIKVEIGNEIAWEDAFDYVQKKGKEEPHCHINKHSSDINSMGDVFCSCTPDACVLLKQTVQLGSEFKPWKYYGKSRFRAVIDPTKCVDCGKCKNKRCMFDAIDIRYNRETGKEKHFVIEELCMGCGCCVETCPTKAMTMVCVEDEDFLNGYRKEDESLSEVKENVRPGEKIFKKAEK